MRCFNSSEENRRKIANALGFKYEDFLEMGRAVLAGNAAEYLAMVPAFDEAKTSHQAAEIIEKILFVVEKREEELPYINALVEFVYHKLTYK